MTFGEVLLCFVPLFVAMDAIGAVPVYVALTDGLSAKERGRLPLGVPLISGPAVLTTLVILKDQFSVLPTALAFLANVAVVGLAFFNAKRLLRALGPAGTKGLSKVTALILAAIAVMMIRVGLQSVLTGPQ